MPLKSDYNITVIMMKYSILAIAAFMLFPVSAFAMENDGTQDHPCKGISDLQKRIECRVDMLDKRTDRINAKDCNGLTITQCEEATAIYAQQLVLIDKVRTAIESFSDISPQERKALISGEIADALHTIHLNCEYVKDMRQA